MSIGGGSAGRDNDTGRIEAFSDEVFAIAITLLIIEIGVPPLRGRHDAVQPASGGPVPCGGSDATFPAGFSHHS